MRLISELIEEPGVRLAADYPYRGDRISMEGEVPRAVAEVMSVVCRSNTTSVRMQSDIIRASVGPERDFPLFRGWITHGARKSVCTISNTFVVCDNDESSLTSVVRRMLTGLRNAPDERI